MEPVERNQFFLGTEVVGYFEDQLSSSPGLYRDMPFRGPGHLRLVQALASTGPQRCDYIAEGEAHYFIAERVPSLHVLQVPTQLVIHRHNTH
jgi:hypothetical protein